MAKLFRLAMGVQGDPFLNRVPQVRVLPRALSTYNVIPVRVPVGLPGRHSARRAVSISWTTRHIGAPRRETTTTTSSVSSPAPPASGLNV